MKYLGGMLGFSWRMKGHFFGHMFCGIPIVKLPAISIAGSFTRQPDEEVGDKVATASQSQPMGTLEVYRPNWEPLVERKEEKIRRQPAAPKESYEDNEYTLLDAT